MRIMDHRGVDTTRRMGDNHTYYLHYYYASDSDDEPHY